MRQYITEKTENAQRHYRFGNIEVEEREAPPENVNIQAIFRSLENNFPSHYFRDLKKIIIGHTKEFDDRDVNAVYRNKTFHITNRQENTTDLMDDIVHEFAHHMETLFPVGIYGDKELIREFTTKRQQLRFELISEGYWVEEYEFENLKYNQNFDDFLYKRVGRNMLKMVTTGLFIRPYAAVSLREYFATGFEAYYLGQRDSLQKISPALYQKITELDNYRPY
jgi:hypothetical protein